MNSSYSQERPSAAIHVIPSSFNLKQAAQISILSKSWNTAWLTRPILDLDESQFPEHYRRHFNLMLFGNKTLPRYEDSNTEIHTFRLCLESEWYCSSGLAAEWTSKAMKLGPSDVTIRLKYESNDIPIDEVFGNEKLIRMCLESVRIDRLEVTLIKCSGLKSLELTEGRISIDSFSNILSCCPLIETISLHSLKFSDDEQRVACSTISLKLTSLVLCELELDRFGTLFRLSDLSTMCPVLKDLSITINDYKFGKGERILVISSRSLETLTFRLIHGLSYFEHDKVPRVEFDVPSIRKFTFEGPLMPNMCFSPTSGGRWDSHVSISHSGYLSNTWFRQLSNFLSNLKESKIHLVLRVCDSMCMSHYQTGNIKGPYACEVDDLTIYTKEGCLESEFLDFLDRLFGNCRPKMITHYVDPSKKDGKIRNSGLLLRRALEKGLAANTNLPINKKEGKIRNSRLLLRGKALAANTNLPINKKEGMSTVRISSLMESQLLHGLLDLKEVHVQELKDEVWMPRTMYSILDDSTSAERIVRFQLKWSP